MLGEYLGVRIYVVSELALHSGKSEECIPQTWDIFYEKWGFMIIFWNFAGVPFTYCYSDVYMATHDPAKYQFSTIGYVALYGTLLTSYYMCVLSTIHPSRS